MTLIALLYVWVRLWPLWVFFFVVGAAVEVFD